LAPAGTVVAARPLHHREAVLELEKAIGCLSDVHEADPEAGIKREVCPLTLEDQNLLANFHLILAD
jgi:hypothetical protein